MTNSFKQDQSEHMREFLAIARGETPSKPETSIKTKEKAKRLPKRKDSAPFSLRLTREERERLEAEAKGKPLGAYIREKLLGDSVTPRRIRRKPSPDHALLGKVLGMLGQSKLANNMNQIAKAAHIGVLVLTPALIEDIEEACKDIRMMRNALMAALGFPIDGGAP
ncbi:plasmid mobilization protein [Hyphococcus sp.]|uniref:plasmid mobilization protein n=1 Tax=Hyphococcus sp. TaxID=2038636 RepID=UPI0035C76207